jgi:TetR/AcrR family fatty acid metabolism transcriptional regulator
MTRASKRPHPTGNLAPRTPRGEKARSKLLQAAIDEFAKRGFHATRVSDIVRRAGVSQPSFYIYFETKDEIYRVLLRTMHDELIALVKKARLPPRLGHEAVASATVRSVTTFLEYFAANKNLCIIGYFQSNDADALKSKIVQLTAENIDAEKSAGYFRGAVESTLLAECMHGSIERLIKTRLLTGQRTPKRLANDIIAIFMSGIQTP